MSTDPSITTTLHQIGWLVSGNCIGERTGAKPSCKLAYSREGIPKSPFMPTVVVILVVRKLCNDGQFGRKSDPASIRERPWTEKVLIISKQLDY